MQLVLRICEVSAGPGTRLGIICGMGNKWKMPGVSCGCDWGQGGAESGRTQTQLLAFGVHTFACEKLEY